jgi:hypothetical protein
MISAIYHQLGYAAAYNLRRCLPAWHLEQLRHDVIAGGHHMPVAEGIAGERSV